ncbi:MAG TPA: protein kinase [Gemmatimonadaceae bacterium]|nr:protein kinase [Gemmatimonadaceae bacterium]
MRDTLQRSLGTLYHLERELGRGGMATVFLARDLRHGRLVAVKVLDPELGAVLGGERFLSEIRVMATLQHPNLLPLFDSGEAGGLLYYTMPYVDGESLRARLERERQLPIDEAVRIATAIASAVDYAHRRGVVHRDLKPENILLHGSPPSGGGIHANDCQPLVADFGIALAVSNAGGARVTQTGLSLGTPQYMSPEQATGDRAIDARTDVYSLGAVTYEMLAGEPPHSGPTAQAVIAKLLTEEPRPLPLLRRAVPPHVDAAVRYALEKLPADRFATAREFADALTGRSAVPNPTATVVGSVKPWRIATAVLATTTALAAAAVFALGRQSAAPAPLPPMRLALDLPPDARPFLTPSGTSFALSPDGTALVYNGGKDDREFFLRRFADLEPRPLEGTREATYPQFSPDGKWVAFLSGTTLKKIPLAGGPAITIADSVGRFAWGPDGTIVFARGVSGMGVLAGAGLWRVSANGGTPRPLTTVDSALERSHGSPSFLPSGDAVVFATFSGPSNDSLQLAAARLSDGKTIRLGVSGGAPVATLGEFILFGRPDGTLNAVAFDPRRLRVTSDPVVVLSGIVVRGGGSAEFAVSPQGTLVYLPGAADRELQLVDRRGARRTLAPVARPYRSPRVSPDGRRVAVVVGDVAGASDIWIYDIPSATLSRVTSSGSNNWPEWTPDGRRLAWTMAGAIQVMWQPVDGSQPAELLFRGSRGVLFARGDSALTGFGPLTGVDWKLVPLHADSARSARTILPSAVLAHPRLSPDGRWLAYASDQSGTREVYVQAFPGPGARVQVSFGGGGEPVWHPSGREIFYHAGSMLMSASLTLSPEPGVVRRDSLFTIGLWPPVQSANYDVMPDGAHFVAIKPLGADAPPVVVVNWLTELRERVAASAQLAR